MNESSGFLSKDSQSCDLYNSIEQIVPLRKGAGGTSLVYSVSIGGKFFFMKLLRPEYSKELQYRSLFIKEYELGRQVDNRHVVKYQSINEDSNGLYLLAEYVRGCNLEEKVSADPEYFQSLKNIRVLFLEILDGLNALHKVGIVHLDLKPDNIMLNQVNNEVKIVDLGFAFENSYWNSSGATLGFSAPEVLAGSVDEIDTRSDLYSAGKVVEYISEKCHISLEKDMRMVVDKCLQENKDNRYSSAAEAIEDLQKKDRIRLKVLFACIFLLLLFVTYFLFKGMSETHWFKDFKNTIAWTLKPTDKDAEFTHVYYKILSSEKYTCRVVGSRMHPNPMIVDRVSIGNCEYSVTEIKDSAFYNAPHIVSVHIPNGIESIGMHAFRGCHGLSDVDLPSSIKRLGQGAFYECHRIISCQLPPNLTAIPAECFALNINLKGVDIPDGVKVLGFDSFAGCEKLENILLPHGLERIERGAFYNCYSLEEISIPSTVVDIGVYAFFHCKRLKHVYMHSPVPPVVSRIFADNHPDMVVHVPASSLEAYQTALHWKDQNIVGDL